MKKTMKRFLSAILIASFMLISGCKKPKEPRSRIVLATDPYYSCEEILLDVPTPEGKELEHRYTNKMKVFSNCVAMLMEEQYVIPQELTDRVKKFHYDPQNIDEYKKLLDEQASYRRTGLMIFGMDGVLKNYVSVTYGSRFMCMTEDPSGKARVLLTAYNASTYVYDSSVLYEISPEGELTNPIVLDRAITSDSDILFLENGNMLIKGDSSVLLYSPEGELLGEEDFGFGNLVERIFQIGKKYYAYFSTEDIYDVSAAPTTYMFEIDPASGKKLGERLKVTCPVHASFLQQGREEIYALLGNGLRKYDLLDGKESQSVFSWKDTDCNYSGIESESLCIQSDNDIYVIRRSENSKGKDRSWQLLHLRRQETNPHAGENIIYLGTIGNLNSAFIEHINLYNLDTTNKNRIVVLEYSGDDLYATEYSDQSVSWFALQRFSTDKNSQIADEVYLEIMGGDGPDILLNFGSFSQFNTERALVDLNTLIDGSASLDRNLLFDNIIRSNERDGKLYQIPLNFSISGMYANPEYVGDRTGWTYDEFRQIDRSLPDGVKILGNVSQSELLDILMAGATSHLVDYNKQNVNFDDPEFRGILDIVKTYGIPRTKREIRIDVENDETMLHDTQMMSAGSLVATSATIYSLTTFANNELYSRDIPLCFIGYPSLNGKGARANTAFSMAITQTSQHKEKAWAFIRSFFEEDVQSSLSFFPVNRNAFDASLEKEYEEDQREWAELAAEPSKEQEMLKWRVPLSEEHITMLRKVVDNIRESASADPTVMMIINEEAPGYFTDARTQDDVVRIIEKRSKAVVQERG